MDRDGGPRLFFLPCYLRVNTVNYGSPGGNGVLLLHSWITRTFYGERVDGGHLRMVERSKAPVKGCFNLQAAANAPGVAQIKLVH